MEPLSVTLDTFQAEMFWSNEEAKENMERMLVTLDTSQTEMFWLNEDAE
jgi:hypothetical protein